MALHHRVGRLETRARAFSPTRCPECGYAPSDPFDITIVGPEVVATMDEIRPVAEQPGDRCAACGRKMVYRIPPPERARVVEPQGKDPFGSFKVAL